MSTSNRLLIGAISGIVATGPMTVAMILMHRRLPQSERYPLPPREITMRLADYAGVAKHMDADERSSATLLSHFLYGAVGGAIYAASSDPVRSPVAKGLGFGLLVWVASYLGWLPAAGVLSSATEHPIRRSLLMVGAHFIWGTAMSGLAALLTQESEGRGSEPFSAAHTPLQDVATR